MPAKEDQITSGSFRVEPDVVAALTTMGVAEQKRKGVLLFAQGDAAKGAYLLVSGRATLELQGKRGRVLSSRTAGPGAVLGLPSTISCRPYSLTATLVEDAEVRFISREQLLALMRDNPQLSFRLLQVLSEEVGAMRREMARLNPSVN